MKLISIYSRKGGSGKTTISFHLCKNLDKSFFITNDDDGGEIVIEKLGSDKASLVKNKISKTMDYLIYDGGGFVDDLSLKFLLNSDFIIIPSNLENRSLRSARKVINELIQNHRVNSNKIIVVINRYKENPKSDDEKRIVQSIFPEIKNIIYIRETKILENMINENLNFDDFKGKYPLHKQFTTKLEQEFNSLIELIK